MTIRQVTLSARHYERIIFRDVQAEDDAAAAEMALRDVGEKDWAVAFVNVVKRPAQRLSLFEYSI